MTFVLISDDGATEVFPNLLLQFCILVSIVNLNGNYFVYPVG